jgi:hypothetical protein
VLAKRTTLRRSPKSLIARHPPIQHFARGCLAADVEPSQAIIPIRGGSHCPRNSI